MSFMYLEPRDTPVPASHHLAARASGLEGKRLALLDNGKPKAGAVLAAIAARLQASHGVCEVLTFQKPSAYRVAPANLLNHMAGRTDVFLTGVGD